MKVTRSQNSLFFDFLIAFVSAIAIICLLSRADTALAQAVPNTTGAPNCPDINGGALDAVATGAGPFVNNNAFLQAGETVNFTTAIVAIAGGGAPTGRIDVTAAPAGVATGTILPAGTPPQAVSYTATVTGLYTFQYQTGTITGDDVRYTARCSIRSRDSVESFILNRLDRLITEEPDRNRYIRRLTGSTWGLAGGQAPLAFNATGNSSAGTNQFNFATSLQAIANAEATRAKQQLAALGYAKGGYDPSGESIRQGLDVWVEGHYTSYDDDSGTINRDGDVGIVYVGADKLITTNTLVGLMIQYDWADEESAQNTDVDGNGWMFGPYMSTRLGKSLFFDLRAAWGESDNDSNSNGVTGSFDTERWLVRGNLTGNWQRGNWRFTPSVGITYAEEDIDSFTDSNGTFNASNTVELGRLTFGPEISQRIVLANGTVVEPHASLTGLWDFERPDSLTFGGAVVGDDEFRMQTEVGLIVNRPDDVNFRATLGYDGLFSDDLDAWTARAWVNIPLGRRQ